MEESKKQNPNNATSNEGQQTDVQPKTEGQQTANDDCNLDNKPGVTVDSLMEEIAKLKAESIKNKNALDKALKEKGDLTKQYREVLTETQQAKIDKETAEIEHKEYIKELEEYKAKNEAVKRYMTVQHMSPELAEKAAEAETAGDMDALAEIQRQHSELALKKAKAEWQKSIPQPQFGTGEYASMTKDEIMAIKDPAERRKAIASNLGAFGK